MDYYEVLEVSNTASNEDIKKSYRELAKKWHPDLNNNSVHAEEVFKKITEAYSVLSNPELRKEYDSYYNKEDSDKASQEAFEQLFQHAVTLLIQGNNRSFVLAQLICLGCSFESAEFVINTAQNYIREVSATLDYEAPVAINEGIIGKFPNWLRWVLFLPSAIAAYLLTQLFVVIVNMFGPMGDSWWVQFINSIAGSYAFIVAGAFVAPKHKFNISLGLSLHLAYRCGPNNDIYLWPNIRPVMVGFCNRYYKRYFCYNGLLLY